MISRASRPPSPYVPASWLEVKLIMKSILGIPFTSVPMTFAQIRSTLEEKTGNKAVSVPTIEVGGEYVTDSFKIAEWVSLPSMNRQQTLTRTKARENPH